MIKNVVTAGILLLLLIVGHLVYRHEDGRFELPSTPPQGSFSSDVPPGDFSSQPPPLEEEPSPVAKKKHFWNRKPDPGGRVELGHEGEPPGSDTGSDTGGRDIPRQMVVPQRPAFERPAFDRRGERDAGAEHFSGAKLFVWALDHTGRPTCLPGEELIAGLFANCHGFTIGEDARFDIWIVRVPPNSEDCPRIVFYDDGRPERPEMIGYGGPWQFPIIYARLPRSEPNVNKWVPPCPVGRGQQLGQPFDALASSGFAAPRRPSRGGWGPGLGIRYRSNTDLGLGFGFGSGWSAATCGGQ